MAAPDPAGLLARADDGHGGIEGDHTVVGVMLGAVALVHRPAHLGCALNGTDQQPILSSWSNSFSFQKKGMPP